MNIMITAHLKRSFDAWKELFDNDSARAEFCDESRTMVGKVDDRTALIVLFGVDQAKMNARLSSPEFVELVEDYVETHDVYTLSEVASD
jgi:hypothetical protein